MTTTSGLPPGLRAALPLLLPTAVVGLSFGLLAAPLLGAVPAIVMSALVWSGTAQFAALGILGGGGGPLLAGSAGLLANTRYLPMGFAVAPSMTGRRRGRFWTGALLADASFVIGHRAAGRFDLSALRWAAPPQYVGWVGGTVAGVLGADTIGDPDRFGLDVLFPVFYLSLLLDELRPNPAPKAEPGPVPEPGASRRAAAATPARWQPVVAAVLAGGITAVLTPAAPAGVPVLAAAAAALIGLVRFRRPSHTDPEGPST